jgi:hypothetical protein
LELNLNNPKGASFKENHLMTTARVALRTTSIFRFRSLTNNLNFLTQIYKDWSKLFVRFIRNNFNQGVYNLIEVISLWTEQKVQSILNYLRILVCTTIFISDYVFVV